MFSLKAEYNRLIVKTNSLIYIYTAIYIYIYGFFCFFLSHTKSLHNIPAHRSPQTDIFCTLQTFISLLCAYLAYTWTLFAKNSTPSSYGSLFYLPDTLPFVLVIYILFHARLFMYCTQMWSLPFAYPCSLSACLGVPFN